MNNLPFSLFNTAQLTLKVLGIRPLLCHEWKGDNFFCIGCQPGDTFECHCCGRLMPWCYGGSDEYEEICDTCCRQQNRF
jgi:hypothetical protein